MFVVTCDSAIVSSVRIRPDFVFSFNFKGNSQGEIRILNLDTNDSTGIGSEIDILFNTFNSEYFDHNYKGTKFTTKDITIKDDELYLNMNNLKNNNFGYSGIAVYSYPPRMYYLEYLQNIRRCLGECSLPMR